MSILEKIENIEIKNIETKNVFKYFEEICAIPHGSGNIDEISNYLVRFAEERNLKYRQDEKKNVIIWKDACKSNSSETVIIQGHMDMVAVKTDDCKKNLEKEGLDLEINGDYIEATGTSLGGDDGIAVAYALALLGSDEIIHPKLEVIITVDEEIGMLGADYLDTSDIKGKLFINIDSEDEGIFTVSCAGGQTNICHVPVEKELCRGNMLRIKITDLAGGHSGVDINKGKLNANKVMASLLEKLIEKNIELKIISISGGEKDNAIAKLAEVTIAIDEKIDKDNLLTIKDIETLLITELEAIKKEFLPMEKEARLTIEKIEETGECFSVETSKNIISLLNEIPNGVIKMNPIVEDMVQTSLNMGIVESLKDEVKITMSLRSSDGNEKNELSNEVESIVKKHGGNVELHGVYPGWAYRENSKLRDVFIEAYEAQYGKAPIVEGIHAGLECGLFASKIDNLDCISFGPQMYDIHTTNEKLSISSTIRTWELLKKVLEKL